MGNGHPSNETFAAPPSSPKERQKQLLFFGVLFSKPTALDDDDAS